MAYKNLARAAPPRASHSGCATLAHFTASSTSLLDVNVIPESFSPVAGLQTAISSRKGPQLPLI